ncbi:MAG: phytase [Pseudoxanthomonas sp.]
MKSVFRSWPALCIGLFTFPTACAHEAAGAEAPLVTARAQTQPGAGGKAEAAAFADDAGIVAAAALAGLQTHAPDGSRLGDTPAGEAVAVAAIGGVELAGDTTTVVAAIDATGNRLRLFRTRGVELEEIGARAFTLDFAAEGVCLYRHPLDGALYAFVVGDGGEIDQQILYPTGEGRLDVRQVRRISVPSTLKQCAADGRGHVYAVQETTGVWRFNANPEADVSATIIDAPRLGHLDGETKGVALYDGGAGNRWLLTSDTDAGRINVYDRDDGDTFVGAFRVGAPDTGTVLAEPGPLAATAVAVLPSTKRGALLVTDEDAANYKLLAIDDIAAALGLPPPTVAASDDAARKPATVMARVESAPVGSYGDAADDPAIWAHPGDPARSLVVATDKKAGLHVYDMQGRVLHFVAAGKMNNVDLRDGFDLGGEKIVLVAASNRTDKSIGLYRLDTETGALTDVADGPQPTGLGDPYGLCMYRSARDGRSYVLVNGDDTRLRQWQLVATKHGRVRARLVRDLNFDSQTEGCVADDDNGNLFVDEEDVALWKLSAEPDGGDGKIAVARIADNPALKDDLEGLGIYDLGGGRGYIVVSSQGNDSYAVFRREGAHEYLGSFAVVANPALGIDGISETDGLEISSHNLGPGFEHGAMIAQDGRNVMPMQNQNYKYVPWKEIADALGLELRDN